MVDEHQDNKEVVASNLILLGFYNGYKSIFNKKFFIKRRPDAVTDVINEEDKVFPDEYAKVMARNISECEIKDELNVFGTNWPEENLLIK